ncbi:MAG: transposase [Magnetococcales bacterium]|nr:transposase [Magnetococcales bacterium]
MSFSFVKLLGGECLTIHWHTGQRDRNGILAYYDFKISTGSLEAANNKIKTLQRMAFGFRDK